MTPFEKTIRVTLVVIAVGYGVSIYRTLQTHDDGGPAMGALCMGLPAFLILLVAASTWPKRWTAPGPPLRVRRAPGTFCTQCGRDLTCHAGGCSACGGRE